MSPDKMKRWKTTVNVTATEIEKQAESQREEAAARNLAQNSQGQELKKRKPAEFAGVSDADAQTYAQAGYGKKSDPA